MLPLRADALPDARTYDCPDGGAVIYTNRRAHECPDRVADGGGSFVVALHGARRGPDLCPDVDTHVAPDVTTDNAPDAHAHARGECHSTHVCADARAITHAVARADGV